MKRVQKTNQAVFKYDERAREDFRDIFPKGGPLQNFKEGGWQALSKKDWQKSTPPPHERSTGGFILRTSFNRRVFEYYPCLMEDQTDAEYLWAILTSTGIMSEPKITKQYFDLARDFAHSAGAIVYGHWDGLNLSVAKDFIFKLLLSIKSHDDFRICFDWYEHLSPTYYNNLVGACYQENYSSLYKDWLDWFSNAELYAKNLGFEQEFTVRVLEMLKRNFPTTGEIVLLFTKDNYAKNLFGQNTYYVKMMQKYIIFYIETYEDNFNAWEKLYNWDFAKEPHKDKALRQMSFHAKDEAHYKTLINFTKEGTHMQLMALQGLQKFRV